jgi:hypothetical protein
MDYAGDVDLDREVIHDAYTGQRLTNQVIDQENDTIDRRYGLVPGGKSLSGGSTHSPKFQVVVGEKTAERVRQAASDAHMSVSRWLRNTVEEKLAA